jgi:sugar phosphate permease
MSWASYFSYYFTRKNFSAVKSSIGLAEVWLKWIDFAYLLGYCVGQFVAGALGDVIGPRLMVTAGMLGTAVITVVFATADSLTTSFIAVYIVCSALNGLFQATGWPGNGKLMTSWYPAETRGEVMGYWGTCYQLGGLAATAVAGWLLEWGWHTVYYGAATWVASMAIAYWISVRDRPSDVGYADLDEAPVGAGVGADAGAAAAGVDGTQRNGEPALPSEPARVPTAAELAARRRAHWGILLRNPLTYFLGLCYFGLKLMRYGFLFWLPYYLHVSLGYGKREAVFVSIAFELGGALFVVVAGLVADRLLGKRRILVASACSLLLFGSLFLYRELGTQGVVPNIAILMLVGGFLFGADTLVSGAAAQDLGGPHAASLACGLINGLGSMGAVAQALLLLPVKNAFGWDGVFVMFQAMAVLSCVVLLPYVRTRPAAAATAGGQRAA